MTLSLRLDGSHAFSWTSEMRSAFAITIVPEKRREAPLDLFVLLDVSGSMNTLDIDPDGIDPSMIQGYGVVDGKEVMYINKAEKKTRLELALEGIRYLLEKVDPKTRVTLITFADQVKVLCRRAPPNVALGYLEEMEPDGNTALHSAIKKAISLIDEHPARIILLTDGYPTDVEDEDEYSKFSLPQFSQMIPIGVGEYNAKIMNRLAERSNGRFYHLNNLEELSEILEQERPKPSAGIKVRLNLISEFPLSLINYSAPINIGTIEGVVRIFGFLNVPPLYSGEILKVRLTYVDTADNREKSIEKSLAVTPAKDVNQFRSGVNQSVLLEASYYQKMREVQQLIDQGMQVEATKKIAELGQIAERTRKQDLIESTRKMAGTSNPNEISSEITKRMRS
ncbi:VWA domain-containing protein [Metallosphaera hakonensis]|nr:VWA domain-containing protein [Metallosphaera hakonensis]